MILVHGSREDTQALREDVARVLAPMGLDRHPSWLIVIWEKTSLTAVLR